MRNPHHSVIMVIRWLIMLFACLVILGVGFVVEHELISRGWAVCPQVWWRESPGLCAFPFVSIITLSFAYALKSLLLLITVALLAPVRKFTSCIVLLAGLALWQMYDLIFTKLSWVALVSLSSVIAIATCFIFGAYVTHNLAFKRDALKRAH
jgi:hypothetical protein